VPLSRQKSMITLWAVPGGTEKTVETVGGRVGGFGATRLKPGVNQIGV